MKQLTSSEAGVAGSPDPAPSPRVGSCPREEARPLKRSTSCRTTSPTVSPCKSAASLREVYVSGSISMRGPMQSSVIGRSEHGAYSAEVSQSTEKTETFSAPRSSPPCAGGRSGPAGLSIEYRATEFVTPRLGSGGRQTGGPGGSSGVPAGVRRPLIRLVSSSLLAHQPGGLEHLPGRPFRPRGKPRGHGRSARPRGDGGWLRGLRGVVRV